MIILLLRHAVDKLRANVVVLESHNRPRCKSHHFLKEDLDEDLDKRKSARLSSDGKVGDIAGPQVGLMKHEPSPISDGS